LAGRTRFEMKELLEQNKQKYLVQLLDCSGPEECPDNQLKLF